MRFAVANSDVATGGGTRVSEALRKVPSGASLALFVPVGLLYWQVGGPSSLLTDPDIGVHVRTGEWILAHHAVPRHDLYSFAIAGRPWFDWEWLSDLAYALLHRWHGLAAITAFSLAVLCATSVLIYLTARLHGGRIVALGVTCLVMATTTIHWLTRPHLLTWLLVAVFCWAIERARVTGDGKPLLALPVLMALWVNLHPGFLAGVFIPAVWCAAEFVVGRLGVGQGETGAGRNWCRWFGFTALACLAATVVNPYGIQLHRHIAEYLLAPRSVTADVAEWLSPDFRNPRLYWFELLLPLGSSAALWHGLRGRLAWCVLTLAWMHLALASVRNVPLFAIVCAAPVANLVEHLVQHSGLGDRLDLAEASLRRSTAATLLCCGIACGFVFGVGCRRALRLGPSSSLPVAAIAHLPPGRLFTTDRWADYLIYADPGRAVFFDCRNDLYGLGYVKDYLTLIRVQPGWQAVAAKYAFAVALVPVESPVRSALSASADWLLSYEDSTAAVFVRSTSLERKPF